MKMKSIVSSVAAFALMASSVVGELPQYFPVAYAEEVNISNTEPAVVKYDGKDFWGYFNGTENVGFNCSIPIELENVTMGLTTVGELRERYSGIRFDDFEITSVSDEKFDPSVLTYALRMQTGTDANTYTTYDRGELDSYYFDFDIIDEIPDSNVVLSLGFDLCWWDDLRNTGFKSGDVIRFNAENETRTTYDFDMSVLPTFIGTASVGDDGAVSIHTSEYITFDEEINFEYSLYGDFNKKYHSVGFQNIRPIYVNGQPVPEDNGRTSLHVQIRDENGSFFGACYTGWDSNVWLTDSLSALTYLDGNSYLTGRPVLDDYTFNGITVGIDIENAPLYGITDGDIVEITYGKPKPVTGGRPNADGYYHYTFSEEIVEMTVTRESNGSLSAGAFVNVDIPNISWGDAMTWGELKSMYAGVKYDKFTVTPSMGTLDDYIWNLAMLTNGANYENTTWDGNYDNADKYTFDFATDPYNDISDEAFVRQLGLNIFMDGSAITELGLEEGDTVSVTLNSIEDNTDSTLAPDNNGYYHHSFNEEIIKCKVTRNEDGDLLARAIVPAGIYGVNWKQNAMSWGYLKSKYTGVKFDKVVIKPSIGTVDDFYVFIGMMASDANYNDFTWDSNLDSDDKFTFDFNTDITNNISDRNAVRDISLNIDMISSAIERLGLKEGDTYTITLCRFDDENEITSTIEPSGDSSEIPEDDKVPEVTINPAFNIINKANGNVVDLTEISLRVKEIFETTSLDKAIDALGDVIKENSHINLLDMTLFYKNKDFSNGYNGLVQVIIPLPENHKDKTFALYRLTEVNGKTVKEVIEGEQTEDSYIVYLEHFSEYALVGEGDDDDTTTEPEKPDTEEPGTTTPAADFYKINLKTDGHGKASANVENPEEVEAGTEVTLTATPNSGYKFNKWTVVKGDVVINDNKFTMPESDVEIKAEFTKTNSGSSSGGGVSSGGSRRPSSTSSSTAVETVTVNGKSGSWTDVISTINSAANGGTITISGSTDIPADVIAAAAKKNIKLEVKANDTFTWVIDATKAGEGAKSLSVSDSAITATNKTIKSGETSKDFRVTESKLGTGASLRYNAGTLNSGKFANLFKVNGSALEFVAVVKVDAAGSAFLPITAAGTYKIVISDETKLVGDLNNSMDLNALDAAMMLKKLADGDISADEVAKFDFNGDGKTNALDAAAILKWVVNK